MTRVYRALGPLTLLTLLGAATSVPGGASVAEAQVGPLAEVAGVVRVGDDAAALARLEALPPAVRDTPRARYLVGRLEARLGNHRAAVAAWAGQGPGLPEAVAEDLHYRRAVAQSHVGMCAAARPVLGEVGAGRGRRAAIARAREAECALEAGDLAAATGALGRVALEDAAGVDTFAVRLSLADAHHRNGDDAAAAAELHALLVARPEHPDAELAEQALTALGATLDFSAEERLARAERLHRQRRHRAAVAELDAGGRPRASALRGPWLHLRGMSLFKTRHAYAEAAVVLAEAARQRGPTAEEDEFHAARALSRSDEDGRAIVAYRRFARRHRGHRRAAEAEYLAAWLELRLGRRRGETAMARFIRAHRTTSYARSGTFELGLSAYERGQFSTAARRFEQFAGMGTDALVRGRGLYWAGRAHQRAGNRRRAAEHFRDALGVEALHYYALWSRQRLVELGEDPGDPFPPAEARPARSPLGAPRLPEDARFYADLGLRADAVAALRSREAEVKAAQPEGRGLEGLVAAYHQLGEASRPYRLVVRGERAELQRRPDAANAWIWRAAYPEAFRRSVAPAARGRGLDPEYLWAIMRQESGYEPEVVSYADAIGLLQLMPATAAGIARGLGVPFAREMLFDPSWNARLAAQYNARLRRTYALPLAFAAYNGGGHRVTAWLEERGPMDLDQFIERIPITQTKNYARRVTSHYARYVYLREGDGAWPFELPARVPVQDPPEEP